MKFQGKVQNWNDDKGFGFVEPNGGGERAFVHIKAFKPRSRRPVNGELIVYELVQEKDGRFKASNIKFVGSTNSSKTQKPKRASGEKNGDGSMGSILVVIIAVVFPGLLLVSFFLGSLPVEIVGLYGAMSVIAFISYTVDKSAAQHGRWRTSESTLHTIALIGGWPGAFFAQRILRHKSSKKKFQVVYWATVILNLIILAWVHTEIGAIWLHSFISF